MKIEDGADEMLDRFEEESTIDKDLNRTEKIVIEVFANYPDMSAISAAEITDTDAEEVEKIRNRHAELIIKRAEECGSVSMSVGLPESQDGWDKHTSKQKAVIRELAKEDEPANPSRSLDEISRECNADVHAAYVADVIDTFEESIRKY